MTSKAKEIVRAESESTLAYFVNGFYDQSQSIWTFQENDKTYWGFGFQLSPTRRSFNDYLKNPLGALLIELPTESVVQFAVQVETGVPEEELEAWTQSRFSEKYPEMAECAQTRRDFLKTLSTEDSPEWVKASQLRRVRHFVFVKVPLGTAMAEQTEKRKLDIASIVSGCTARLANCTRRPRLLGKSDYEGFEKSLGYPVLTAPAGRTRNPVRVETQMHQNGITRAALPVVATYHPVRPSSFGAALADVGLWSQRPLYVNCPYWAFTIFHVKTGENTDSALKRSLKPRTRLRFPSSHRNITHTTEALKNRRSWDIRTKEPEVLVSAGIILFSRPEDADANLERALHAGRLAGYRMQHLQAVAQELMPYWRPFVARWDAASPAPWVASTGHEARCLSEYPDDADQAPLSAGGVPLVTLRGQLTAFNPWHSPTNYNFALVGQEGCGRSTFSRDVMASVLTEGGQVHLFTYSDEWVERTPTEQAFRPKLVRIEAGSPLSLNPFSALFEEEAFWDSFAAIVELIVSMAYPLSHKQDVPAHADMLVGRAVADAWHKNRENTSLSDVLSALRQTELRQGAELADLLEPFASGDYSGWFEGPRERYEASDFVVYMCATHRWHPAGNEKLHETLSCAAMLAIFQDVKAAAKGQKQLVYVGAPVMLPGYGRGVALEAMLRQGKKYNLSVGAEALNVDDFYATFASRLALERAATLALMKQGSDSVDVATHMRLLDEHSSELVKTVNSGPESAKIFVRNGFGNEGIYRFFADALTLSALSDNWRNRDVFMDARASGASVTEALKTVAARDYRSVRKNEKSGC